MYNYLITGGTGTLGTAIVKKLSQLNSTKKIVVFSRNEDKQFNMKLKKYKNVEFVIGDIRDIDSLNRASQGIDIIIHTAALKHVSTAEINPKEAVMTNINGSQNIIDCAKKNNVKYVLGVSTDKACNSNSSYGATKLVFEKMFIAANNDSDTKFSLVRFGNILGSNGSVFHIWEEAKKNNKDIVLTEKEMTRFFIKPSECASFIHYCIQYMQGGEIFIPKMISTTMLNIAKLYAQEQDIKISGIKPGEKIHEEMISEEEIRNTVVFDSGFIVEPHVVKNYEYKDYEKLSNNFTYKSNNSFCLINEDELKKYLEDR